MKDMWTKKLEEFPEEIQAVRDATGESLELTEKQKEQTLGEFLKTDKARLRAFFSVLKKIHPQDVADDGGNRTPAPKEEKDTSNEGEKEHADFSKELKTLRVLDSVDQFIEQYKQGQHSTLEPRQIESLVKISAFLRSGKKRGYVELPTGLGKTVIFSELIEAVKDVPDLKILVVGSGNINAMQNAQKIERFGGEQVGQYFGNKKELHATVTACNYAGLRNAIEREDFKSGDFDLVLLDEVHDGLGEVTQDAIERTFKDETIIGFSATATHESHRGVSASDFLPTEIDTMGIVEAVKANLLSAFKVEVIKVPIEIEGVRVIGGDYQLNELERKVNTPERNDLVVASYLQFYREKKSKTIAFCVARQHTKDLAAAFEAKGITVGVLTGELHIDEREAVLQKWKSGDIEVLCGSKLSWQALDETEATVGLNVAPSLSEKDVIQRGGRLLRRSERIHKKKALIVEFLDEWRETRNRPLFYSEILETAEAVPDKWAESPLSEKQKESAPIPEGVEGSVATHPSVSVTNVEVEEEPTEAHVPEQNMEIGERKKVTRLSDATEVMDISNQNRKFRNEEYFKYAPPGWMSSNIIAVELGTTTRAVESAINDILGKDVPQYKLRKLSGTYLSALGIKRTFYGPEILNAIYTYLVGSTREEKIKTGALEGEQTFDELEKVAVAKEAQSTEPVDLDWRDYDVLPSFTSEGDSLEDEEQGTSIGDTSELHEQGESIEGKINDLIGYRYQVHKNKIINSKQGFNRPKTERALKNTSRYGLNPDETIHSTEDFRTEMDEREQEELVLKILSAPDILTDREKKVLSLLYFENDEGINTFSSIATKFHLKSSMAVRNIHQAAMTKIARVVDIYERTGTITLKKPLPIRKGG